MASSHPRLSVPHPPSTVRRWIAPFFAVAGLALLPWTLWLGSALPPTHNSEHWDIVWAGFDSALAVAFLLVALAAWKRSPWLEATTAVAGTMLISDAWFDVMLESRSGLWFAIAQAVLIEIPLAVFCFSIAHDAERFVSGVHAILDEVHAFATGDEPSTAD